MPKFEEDDRYITVETPEGKRKIAKSGISPEFLAQLRSGDASVVSAKSGGKRVLNVTHEQDGTYYLNDGTKTKDAELAKQIEAGNVGSAKLPTKPSVVDRVQDFSENVLAPTMRDTVTDAVVPVRPLWSAAGAVSNGLHKLPDVAERTGIYAADLAHTFSGGKIGTSREEGVKNSVGAPVNLTLEAQAELKRMDDAEKYYWPDGQPGAQQEQATGVGPSSGPLGVPNLVMAAGGVPPTSNSTSARASSAGGGTNFLGKASKDVDAAAAQEAAASKQLYDVARQQAAIQAGVEDERAKILADRQAKQQQILTKAQTLRDEWATKIKASTDELAAIDTRIDPQRFWANKGTGEKVTAAIAVFLGGLPGGPNRALEILDGAVQRDIMAQKSTFEQRRALGETKLGAQKNSYGMFREMLGDERLALDATYDAALGVAEQRLKSMLAGTKDAEVQAKGADALAQISTRRADKQAEIAGKRDQLAISRAQLAIQQEEMQIKRQAAEVKTDGKDNELFIPGVGYALTKKAAEVVQEMASAHNATQKTFSDLIRLRETYGSETLPSDAKAAMKVLSKRLIVQLNKSGRLGSLDNGSQEILEGAAGGNVDSFSPNVLSGLKAAMNAERDSFQEMTTPYMQQRTDAASQLGIQYVQR